MGESMRHPITTGDEGHERDLNRHRGNEQRNAREDVVARLNARGIDVTEDASVEALVEVSEAVDAFEHAVVAAGGDLMVDSPPSTEPDDPRFVLPKCHGGESLHDYAVRIRNAAARLYGERAD